MTRNGILVVEDEGIVARDIERQLLRLGYEPVGKTSTGEEAVALAGALRPQLVLMDIRLGGEMDGIDAAIAIRAQFSIPSIFLTAYATDEVVERAKRAEPLGYLIKPFDEHSLRTTIEIAIHKDRADSQLRQSEARYRAVVQSAHDAIVTADPEGNIVGWSPAAAGMFGYAEAEILGRPLTMLMPTRYHEAVRGGLPLVLAQADGAANAHELEGVRRDGREFPIEMSASKWEAADGWFVTGFVRDTSERKRAEASLLLQSAALNAAANAIVITDRDGTIEWVNPAFTTVTGYRPDEAIGRNPRDLVKSGAHDQAFYRHMWQTLLAGNVWQGEMTNRRKDDLRYVEEQTITPVRNPLGAITHFIAVKRDLTEQKHLQEQFLQAQKMEVVGRLAGGIAHDFNNLLTVINGTADIALMDLPKHDPMRAEFEQIQQAGNRAARLTRQLLAISRKQILAPTCLNVNTQVSSTVSMLRRVLGEDIELVVRAPQELDNVIIDPGQLEQVLMNLVVNARDAMPAGGTLTIETRNVDVDTAFAAGHPGLAPGRYVRLAVTDTGEGMTAAVRDRLFEPFFTTKDVGKGTGLGLATVHSIVTQAGGAIAVDSEPGQGASFRIFLPRVAQAQTVNTPGPRKPVTGTETILLVEDEDGLRALAMRMLQSAGYTVIAAGSARQALSLLAHHDGQVHLVFTDIVMPGMSGADLAATISATHPAIKALFTSGYSNDARTNLGGKVDTLAFIAKPYTVASLTSKVREVLDDRQA